MKSKILLLVPDSRATGGIVNYYQVIKKHFDFHVDYFIRGSRTWPYRKSRLVELYRAVKDVFRFFFIVKSKKYKLIQTSTSLGSKAVMRDGIFVLVASLLKIKSIVFFRGWDEDFEFIIERKYLKRFKWVFTKADAFIVLSEKFKTKLEEWGLERPIYIETTVVDDDLLKEYSIDENSIKFDEKEYRMLFLARIEKKKGIYEALDTFRILKNRISNIKMIVSGDGFELENCKKYVKGKGIENITFTGFVDGENKASVFTESHVYLFCSYSEGMPNSVLEAMAFGLPVVTRNVGGLSDIFIEGRNGFITDSKDPEVFAEMLFKLLINKNLMKKISYNNYCQAQKNYLASTVVKRLEKIFLEVMEKG